MPETTTNNNLLREGIAHLRGLLGELGDAVEEAESLRRLLTEAEGRVCRVQDQLAAFGLDPALIALGATPAAPPFHGADLPFHAGSTFDAAPAPVEADLKESLNETFKPAFELPGSMPGPLPETIAREANTPGNGQTVERLCLGGCGKAVSVRSTTGYCRGCHMRNRNREGETITPQPAAAATRPCSGCGKPIGPRAKTGMCRGCAGAAILRGRHPLPPTEQGAPPTEQEAAPAPSPAPAPLSGESLRRLLMAGRSAAFDDPECIARRFATLFLADDRGAWVVRHMPGGNPDAVPEGAIFLEVLILDDRGRTWYAERDGQREPVGRRQIDEMMTLLTERVVPKDDITVQIESGTLGSVFTEAHGLDTAPPPAALTTAAEEVPHAAAA